MKIDFQDILFQIVNFSVVLGALTFLLYKPVLKIFAERSRRIEEGQKAAQKALEQQAKIDEIKQKTEAEMKKKAAQALKEATKEAAERKAELIAEAEVQAKAEIAKLKDAWKTEKEQQISELNKQVVTAVLAATEKVVGKSLTTKDHEKLIDAELKTVLKAL